MAIRFDIDHTLDWLAERLRRHYLEKRRWFYLDRERQPVSASIEAEYPEWDGGLDPWDREQQPVWPGLVDFMVAEQLTLEDWLTAALALDVRQSEPPQPAELMDPGVVARCRLRRQRRQESEAALLSSEWQRVATRVTYGRDRYGWDEVTALDRVLGNHHCDLGYLFRFCYAHSVGLEDVAQSLAVPALADYACDQEMLDLLWRGLLPEELKQAAAELRGRCAPRQ